MNESNEYEIAWRAVAAVLSKVIPGWTGFESTGTKSAVKAIELLARAKHPDAMCGDCPPIGYPTDKTRCNTCPRKIPNFPIGKFAQLAAETLEPPGLEKALGALSALLNNPALEFGEEISLEAALINFACGRIKELAEFRGAEV